MRCLFFLLMLFFISCKPHNETEKLHETLSGEWLIVYPDHHLSNAKQRKIYGRIQDSIVSLTGLKLIILSNDGNFRQVDSIKTSGKWGITANKDFFIEKGGKGFEHFVAKFTSYEKAVLKLTEFVEAEGEKIKLVWELKRIEDRTATELFADKNNTWRNQAVQQESPSSIKERLASMLQYYSNYYYLVNRESSFFIPSRVMLPFKFYQHAVGIKPFRAETPFAHLFFDTLQAKDAHQYLERAMARLRGKFPTSGSNFVEEYADYMKLMAAEVIKKN